MTSRFGSTATGLALILATAVASAAPPASSAPSTGPTTPASAPPAGGPAPSSGSGASSASAPPAAGTPQADQAEEEAATRFKRGLQLFDEGDYTLALVEFERAYQLSPNYRALYNIALVNMQLGRYADASRTFQKYLDDGGDGIAPSRRDEVKKTLQDLTLRTATVEITTNVPTAEVSLDNKPVDASRLQAPMLIDAGEHTLRANAPGYRMAYKTVTLAGADHFSVRLELVPLATTSNAPVPQERGRTFFWPGFVATGALAAGAIAGGIVMLDATSRLNTLKNTFGSSASQRASDTNEANHAALAADILTGLAVATGAVSLYLSLRVDHSMKPVTLAISPQQATLSGTF